MAWPSRTATQASQPAADPEHEADRIADAALASAPTRRRARPSRGAMSDRLDLRSSPLPSATRAEMQGRFGCDFSQLRISADAKADLAASGLGAHGPGGAFNSKLLDPKNNKLVPKETVRPKPVTGVTP
jgi:hypothetical protein